MLTMDSGIIESTSMHDSEPQSIEQSRDMLRLTFINVLPSVDDETYYTAIVELSGIIRIIRNDIPIRLVGLEGEGSNVLKFDRVDGKAVLVVDWQHYSQKRSEIAVYEIFYNNFTLTFTMQKSVIDN